MTQSKQNRALLIIAVVLFAAVLGMALLYPVLAPQTSVGSKNITIQVTDNQQNTTDYSVNTNAEYLRQAMEETKGLSFTGTEGQYGLMILSVNGITANWEKDHAWWSIYVNNELANYSIDQQPIADGDVIRLEYTTEADIEDEA